MNMEQALRVVYYGALDPRSKMEDIVKKYSLYFDEMYVVDSSKLLEIYKREYEEFEYYYIVVERCKKIMESLKEFSKETGFLIHFYEPIEISNQGLWNLITQITEIDLKSNLGKEALKSFKSEEISGGMLTGINIALGNSIEFSAAPITNEYQLFSLTQKKFTEKMSELRKIDPSIYEESLKKAFLSKYNIDNLYGFEILRRLSLPISALSSDKIATLRWNKNFEKFRLSLRQRAYDCVERSANLLEIHDKLIPKQVEELQADFRSYQKIIKEDVPKMRQEVIKEVARDSVGIGVLTALAFGIPIGLACFFSSATLEYIFGYYKPKRELLNKYDPCCTFLFNLTGTALQKEKEQSIIKCLRSPKKDIQMPPKNYGALATAAALYFWDES